MSRVYNFSAGPAVLPEEVLRECAEEMLDYKGCGMSVMEMSHRSKVYDNIIKEAEQDLRDLMNIPDNYKVIFAQGGASLVFAGVPMNLMKRGKAAYIITGQWAKKAAEEAEKYGEVVRVASSADKVSYAHFHHVMKARGIKDETLDTIRECGIDLNHWLEGFRDTETSVRKTVKTIQTHPLIPKDVTVRGFIIDSVTGELQDII